MNKEGIRNNRMRSVLHSKIFTLAIVFIALVILFSIWSSAVGSQFFKLTTFRNILSALVLSSFITIGAGALLIGGQIDLSAAAIGAFSGMVLAAAIKGWGMPWYIGIIIALVLCAVFGAVNATMVSVFRFPSFIATLAMMSMAKGLMYLFSSLGNKGLATNISFLNKPIAWIGAGSVGPIPFNVIVMVVFFIVYGILIGRTKLGMKIMLLGGNPVAANLAGIQSRKMTYFLFINGAVLGGVSGIFNTAQLQQGSILALANNQFTGLTAAILGGISFVGGSGGMGGAFLGLLILQTFQIGMGVVRFNQFWVGVFSGILLIVALAVDFFAQMRRNKSFSM